MAPENTPNAETKCQSEAVSILLLALSASTTSADSSLGVLQGLIPQHQLLKASVYYSATSASCEIGALRPQEACKWGYLTFIIPKKDGRINWVSDLGELDKVVRRQQYPLPIIQDILRKGTGYMFFTKIDVSMQYCTFELDEESKDLCIISTPFGKFKCKRLPMGIKCSADFAHEVVENIIFRDVAEVEVYIDDIGIFSDSWEQHLAVCNIVLLQKPQENGFIVTP